MIRLAVSGEEVVWQAVAARLHGAAVTACFDAQRASRSPEACDAVVFASSHGLQQSLIETCLSRGQHVLIAAVPSLPDDVLESLLSAARKSGMQFAIANPDQHLPSRQLIRQHLTAGKLGIPGLVRMHRWEEPSDQSTGNPNALPSPLVLDLDLAISLIGSTPTLVYATETSRPVQPPSRGRTIQIHLGFSEGAMALIDYSSVLPRGAGYQSLSVIGSAGAAYADDHQNMQLLYQGDHPRAVRTDERIRQLVNLTQEFVDALQANRDLAASTATWCNTLAVVRAVEQSLATKKAVDTVVESLRDSNRSRQRPDQS